ncbi:MAG: hypothetical protein Q9179_005989 [Wetmoreana sp. 5 TL-2023]
MADPFSIAGSAVGVISLGLTVTQGLVSFYAAYKDQDSDISCTLRELSGLESIFSSLRDTLSTRRFESGEQDIIQKIESSIDDCQELIEELQEALHRLTEDASGAKATVKKIGRRITYPFRKSTLQKLREDIAAIEDNLQLASQCLSLKDSKRIQDDIADAKSLLQLIKSNQIAADILSWLKAPDATVDHNNAIAKRQPGTGLWLINDPIFQNWLKEDNSFLWLFGFAGCGKSVLCSTAILHAFRQKSRLDRHIGIAFFYFTFNDESKQDQSALLKALILQLSTQKTGAAEDLTDLYKTHKPGTAPPLAMLAYLRRIIQRFDHVYLLIDALDEAPKKPNDAREHVLDVLENLRGWSCAGVHLLVTSRDESDIRQSLDPHDSQRVKMQNDGIDQDISKFISQKLVEDRKLRKWAQDHDQIQEALCKGAKGVFRWVECQFKSLQLCPRSKYYLDKTLRSLPESLDQTYERLLSGIDHSWAGDLKRILNLLCFASRPLKVSELIDTIAVEINEPIQFNHERRLGDADDIREIGSGLIEINSEKWSHDPFDPRYSDPEGTFVRLAHFSVQEYLTSGRIKEHRASSFALDYRLAHEEIARIFLVYLLQPSLSGRKADDSLEQENPLLRLAAEEWHYHYKKAVSLSPHLEDLALRFFKFERGSLATWAGLWDENRYLFEAYHPGQSPSSLDDIATAVYYASYLGLDSILLNLIDSATEHDTAEDMPPESAQSLTSRIINAESGYYGNSLQVASRIGDYKIVRLVLEKGADINARHGQYGNALQMASYYGHESVVQLLLEKGADINARSKVHGSALQVASSYGHESVVQLLLEKGADINARSKVHGSALQAASSYGHESVVQLLLEKGADINARHGQYGNALQMASSQGQESVVQLLLEKGADINTGGGRRGSALQAASSNGYESTVRLLLREGADINAPGGDYPSALQAASFNGHDSNVRLLLREGADINAPGGDYGSALQAASFNGHDSTVRLLLREGADINAPGGKCGNALEAAIAREHMNTALILLENGAIVTVYAVYLGLGHHDHGNGEVIGILKDFVGAQGGDFDVLLEEAKDTIAHRRSRRKVSERKFQDQYEDEDENDNESESHTDAPSSSLIRL